MHATAFPPLRRLGRRTPQRAIAILALAAGASPLPGWAADPVTPAVYIERSQVLPTGNVILAYRVPTVDAEGKLRYYDVSIELFVNTKGKIASNANVVSLPSPKVVGNQYVTGTYVVGSAECTVGVSILPQGGRQMASVSCSGGQFTASWATGPMDSHPFEADLRAAGIDKLSGQETLGWGNVGFASSPTWFGCMGTGEILSAVQNGKSLVLNGYNNANIQACGTVLTLKE